MLIFLSHRVLCRCDARLDAPTVRTQSKKNCRKPHWWIPCSTCPPTRKARVKGVGGTIASPSLSMLFRWVETAPRPRHIRIDIHRKVSGVPIIVWLFVCVYVLLRLFLSIFNCHRAYHSTGSLGNAKYSNTPKIESICWRWWRSLIIIIFIIHVFSLPICQDFSSTVYIYMCVFVKFSLLLLFIYICCTKNLRSSRSHDPPIQFR